MVRAIDLGGMNLLRRAVFNQSAIGLTVSFSWQFMPISGKHVA